MSEVWLFNHEVAGMLAMWAIRQSPYDCPDNLETVVKRFTELWPDEVAGMKRWHSQEELHSKLKEVCEQIPEFLAWNERKNGNQSPFGFSSRYDKPSADDDFIDLDALWRNVSNGLWRSALADNEQEPSNAD